MQNLVRPPTIQGIAWNPGLQAVKDSSAFTSFEEFRLYLINSTRQNSEETRKKYASLIISRLFPEKSLDGINPKSWRHYHDESILEDLARVTTLEAEVVITKFLLEEIMVLPQGTFVDNSTFEDFISSVYGVFKRDSYNRLRQAVIHMGFVSLEKKGVLVQPIPIPDNAFMVLLHARFAPTPRIVRLSDIVNSSFWRLMGIRDEAIVRSILREANAKGLISKYTIMDQLEQINTRFTYDEYLSKALRL